MNSALENLRKSDPGLFKKFMQALQEDLGIPGQEPLASFQCPTCQTRFEIHAGIELAARKGKKPPGRAGDDSLLELLLELARLKKATTGKIHLEFNKVLGEKIKGLKPQQVRDMKREWLKSQVAKYRKER